VSSATLEAGSYGYYRGGALLSRKWGKATHRLSIDGALAENDYRYLFDNQTPDIATDDYYRTKDNNAYSNLSAQYATLASFGESTSLSATASASRHRQEFYRQSLPDNIQKVEEDGTQAMGEARVSREPTERTGYDIGLSGRYTQSLFDDPLGQGGRGGAATKTDSRFPWVELVSNVHWQVDGPFALRGRGTLSYEGYTAHNLLYQGAAAAPEAQRYAGSLAAEASCDLPERLHAALRYTERYTYSDGNISPIVSDRWQHASANYPNASLECLWDICHWLGLDVLGRYECLPISLSDYFGGGASIPNPDLAPEKHGECSVGLRGTTRWLSLSGTAFVGLVRDYITQQEAGLRGVFQATNTDEVLLSGGECELHTRLGERVRLDNNLQYVHAQITVAARSIVEGNDVPYQPHLRDDLRLALNLRWFELGHSLSYMSSYFIDEMNLPDNQRASRLELGAWVRTSVVPHLVLTFRVENYLDVQDEFYPEQPLPGRMYFLTGQVAF
jgi:hypothetical protein